ncbi:MAG: hypothetical protein GKR94_02260 [Gammaproteobacteria bacterium]|nr:hypothetical protein [Gammaproteobacteria bacterium]
MKPINSLLLLLVFSANAQADQAVTLTGHNLTIKQTVRVARDNATVFIPQAAMEKVQRSYDLLMLAACEGHKIYGITTGVGENKDRPIHLECGASGKPTEEDLKPSRKFNRTMLMAHSAAVGPSVSEAIIRATMLVRLNGILYGATGARPKVARLYQAFLNHRIHPVVPSRGSVGMADIIILPHIGLAMMGKGQVTYQGKLMTARDALARAGIRPLTPVGKDGLTITSSNAYSASHAALLIHDIETLLHKADLVFALSLEGLNGNIAPLLDEVHQMRPYHGQGITAAAIRELLAGSYLWQKDTIFEHRPLQDALSFRDVSQVHGATRDTLAFLKKQILVQINASDDNPSVILKPEPVPPFVLNPQAQAHQYYVVKDDVVHGMVSPSANFEPLQWVLPLQSVGVALSHVSRLSCYRMIKLGTEHFTGLTRFLSPEPEPQPGVTDQPDEPPPIIFGAIQKTCGALDTENRALSNPVSVDFLSLAGDIEDHATNAPSLLSHKLS